MAANGILIIDKPQGWTSMDVCAKLRGALGERRIGYAGTLDPMATGVLPIFVGRATRAVEFATEGEKEYVASLRLGVTTNTQDITGQVLAERPFLGTQTDLEEVLSQFRGEILQTPPMYSAIKVGGKKLYELARKGREVERPSRPVTIHSLTLEGRDNVGDYVLRVHCSKGTYVRTLCHDIGQALGCGGCMSALQRTMACGFTLADALPLEQVLQAADPTSLLLGVDTFFAGRPILLLKPPAEKKVRNGMSLDITGVSDGEYRVYSQDQEFLALSRVSQGKLTTIKSFFQIST